MKTKNHCITLSAMLLSVSIGCTPVPGTSFSEPDRPPSRAKASIERVLYTDATSYQQAKSVAEVAIRMRAIDLEGCPHDFRAAYLAHIHAWDDLAVVEQQAIALDAHYSSGAAFMEAFLRGYLGDPFGKAAESVQAYRHLQYNFEVASMRVRNTYQCVEQVAVSHGAELTHQMILGS